jgi:hypothetical protein
MRQNEVTLCQEPVSTIMDNKGRPYANDQRTLHRRHQETPTSSR